MEKKKGEKLKAEVEELRKELRLVKVNELVDI